MKVKLRMLRRKRARKIRGQAILASKTAVYARFTPASRPVQERGRTVLSNPAELRYNRRRVALVRILIDGYSLLHEWRALAPGASRFSAAAREALIAELTRYADAKGTPLTIVFDGSGAPPGTPRLPSSREVEVLFSPAGRTADDLIERAAFRFKDYGEVLVITNDFAERDTVAGFGGLTQSCAGFITEVESVLGEFARDLKHHNRQERRRFRSGRVKH